MPVTLSGATLRRGTTMATSPTSLFAASEVGVWYDPSDLSTMFQDSTGGTPVTGVEQPVGLILDKSKGPVLGSELVTNGGFDTDTAWTKGSGWTISGGKANKASGSVTNLVSVSNVVTAGLLYKVTFDISGMTAGNATIYAGLGGSGNQIAVITNGSYSYYLIGGTTDAKIYVQSSSTFDGSIDNISVKLVPGNHATQSTIAARPVLSARYNLLTKTEQFDDAAWTTDNTTVSQNTSETVSIISTSTVDKIIEAAATSNHGIYQAITISAVSNYTFSVYVKWAAGSTRNVGIAPIGSTARGNSKYVIFDSSGNFVGFSGSTGSDPTYTSTNLGNGWFRFSVTAQVTSAGTIYPAIYLFSGTTQSYLGSTSQSVYLWGADARLTNDGVGIPSYQRVGAATYGTSSTAGVADYDTNGFPYYLYFDGRVDGTGDSLITVNNLDFTSTDKITLIAGLRKLNDTAAIVCELSPNLANYTGTFNFLSGNVTLANQYYITAKGSQAASYGLRTYTPPISNIFSFVLDLRGTDRASTLSPRINGVTPTTLDLTDNATAGTGNFGNYQLYIGARGGQTGPSGLPWLGRLYGLIVRGAASTTRQITDIEAYIESKTMAY